MSESFFLRGIKILAAIVIAGLLGACATATGPKFSGLEPPSADQGDVYLYRTSAFFGVAQSFDVHLDGSKVADLPNASYARLRLKPGVHVLKVVPGGMAKTSDLRISVEPGKSQFYQYDFVAGPLANPFYVGAKIEVRDQTKAVEDMKELQASKAP